MLSLPAIFYPLGQAFLHSLWQMALLFGLYKLITGLFIFSPNDRFRLATTFSWIGSIWFLTGIFWQSTLFSPLTALKLQPFIPGFQQLYMGGLLYYIGSAYLFIFAYASAKGIFQWKAMARLMEIPTGKPPVDLKMFVEKHAALLGITRSVMLRTSHAFSPASLGFLKPVILLPITCITQLSTRQVEALLLHELAHIFRNDFFLGISLRLSEILLYANPFMRFMVHEARCEAEKACDDLVIQFGYKPPEYAHALLTIAKAGLPVPWAMHATGHNRFVLLSRIKRMLYLEEKKWEHTGNSLLFAGGIVAVLFIAAFFFQNSKAPSDFNFNDVAFQSSLDDYPGIPDWQKDFRDARINIMRASFGKLAADNHIRVAVNHKATIDKFNQQTISEENEIINEEKIEQQEIEIQNNQSYLELSASWAGNYTPQATFPDLEKGWAKLTQLIEKLESEKNLDEKHWEQLAALIAYYGEIRKTIYEQAYLVQNPLISTTVNTLTDISENVLVIVYDETTGILTALVVNRSELNDELNLDEVKEDRQQVILLRKKMDAGQKIIRL